MPMIRPGEERDMEAVAALMRFQTNIPGTADDLRDFESRLPTGSVRTRVVADIDGQVVGFAQATFRGGDTPGKYWLRVAVEPEHRREGTGAKLYDALLAKLQDADQLWAETKEGEDEGESFAGKRGFERQWHLFESFVDLTGYAIDNESIANAKQNRVTFARYSDLSHVGDREQRMWRLHQSTEHDIPIPESFPDISFEDYRRFMFEGPTFDPEMVWIALEGEDWAGMAVVLELRPGKFYNEYTGVRRESRGKGIAMALKSLVLQTAADKGADKVWTNNHSNNAPMLAVNRKLGYQQVPGWYCWSAKVNR